MFFIFRMFFVQHRLFIALLLGVILILLGNGAWTLLPLFLASDESYNGLSDEEWLFVVTLSVAILSIVILFIIWAVRYWYFFKLYLIVKQRLGDKEHTTLLWHGTRYLLSRGKGNELIIRKLDQTTGETVRKATISAEGFFKGEDTRTLEEGARKEVYQRYLGPRRNLNDASLFKFMYKILRAARAVKNPENEMERP